MIFLVTGATNELTTGNVAVLALVILVYVVMMVAGIFGRGWRQ